MMDEKTIQAIESVLAKGDRVELIPGPDESLKIIHIKRKIINPGKERVARSAERSMT